MAAAAQVDPETGAPDDLRVPRSRSFCRPPRAFRLTVVHMREEARKRGGTFLSPHYKLAPALLEWKCRRGHVFELVGHQVRNAGMWCPECPNLERLERLQALAAQHGGRLLSPDYRGDGFKHEWRCVRAILGGRGPDTSSEDPGARDARGISRTDSNGSAG